MCNTRSTAFEQSSSTMSRLSTMNTVGLEPLKCLVSAHNHSLLAWSTSGAGGALPCITSLSIAFQFARDAPASDAATLSA